MLQSDPQHKVAILHHKHRRTRRSPNAKHRRYHQNPRRQRRAGHLSRMAETCLPHHIAFSELKRGKRLQCGPKKRWIDAIKTDLTNLKIDFKTWRNEAANRASWREKINESARKRHDEKQQRQKEERYQR
ncbi:hypothetical protein M8J77_018856 [Diaphorina citri]|nr:hypothetical protein M8J77_018856 [Diaphorina citri]